MPAEPNHPLVRRYVKSKRGWSDGHRAVAVSCLNGWTRWLADHDLALLDVTQEDCNDYLRHRETIVAGSTAHKDYQHLMWLYTWLVREEEIDSRKPRGPMTGVDAPEMSAPDPHRTRVVDDETFQALMATFRPGRLLDCRNAAMLSLMYRSGLRRSEVVRCDIDRVDLDAEVPTLEVLGKNKTWRRIPVMFETATWLERYLRHLDRAGALAETGPLFLSTFNGSRASVGRMKAGAVSEMLERRCQRLGLENVTTHMFRRGFATEAKRRGVNDTTIMAVAGWTDARMLDRYQRAQRQALAAAEMYASDPTAQPTGVLRRRRVA